MRYLLTILFCGLMLTACHKDKHDDELPKANLSVLVYIAGDCSLSNFIDPDIKQMMEGSLQLAKQHNLILFVDRKGQPPYYLKVENGDTTRLYTYPQEMKSSDAATLQMAIQWMKDNYEAEQYGLALWGHADGWTISTARTDNAPRMAYGQDTTDGTAWMDIPDMAKALETVCSDKPLRFIFADCCCFQSIESAYELRHCTDYIIASPAEIPGEGAPYQTVIPALFSSGANFWQLATDAYHAQKSYGYQEPLSVVKTEELENLANATKAALTQSLEPLNSYGTNYPDVDSLIYYYNHCLYDINDFLLRNTSADVYAQWKQSFDKAIPYKLSTPVWMSDCHVPYKSSSESVFRDFTITDERFGGVSMYVPQYTALLSIRDRNYQDRQRRNISRMQWYTAAGCDQLGW